MVASETDRARQGSRSPLPSAQTPSPSANDMENIHMRDKRIVRTPVPSRVGVHPSLMGQSPALDFIHTTTTEQSPVAMPPGTDITIQLQTELVDTANELFRKSIEGHAHGEGRAGKAPERSLTTSSLPFPEIFARAHTRKLTDEEYWSSFPPHIKQFVRSIAPSLMRGLLTGTQRRRKCTMLRTRWFSPTRF